VATTTAGVDTSVVMREEEEQELLVVVLLYKMSCSAEQEVLLGMSRRTEYNRKYLGLMTGSYVMRPTSSPPI
jgi:hypothetical protein